MQNVRLYSSAHPPSGIRCESKTELWIKPPHGVHHTDIALADQVAEWQPIAAVAKGYLGNQAKMASDELLGDVVILMLPQFQLFLCAEHWQLLYLLQIATQTVAILGNRRALGTRHEPSFTLI